ncbi:MAG: transglutaminase family protein [Microgenomates group bacterium]
MKFLILAILLLFPKPAYGVQEFSTSFESIYTIKKNGEARVTHTISLKNNLAHIYATEYTLATSGDNLQNITAHDDLGPLSAQSNTQNGITTIHMLIGSPAIGKDQVKTLTLSYDALGIVENIGDTYTINIPRLEKANEAENYKRIIKIEGVEGLSEYIYPPVSSKIASDGYSVFTWDGHQNDSLTLLFGDSVTYKLDLTYELKNSEIGSADTELALPSDTSYQHILLASITPKPKEVRVDNSGNWLARYNLDSQSKMTVKVLIYATVYPVPKLSDPSSTNFMSSRKSKFWQTNSSVVSDLGAKLKTPANIYHYLVDNFTYNYGGLNSNLGRLGAVAALTSPSLVLCTEFTDAFVALSRSQNIPSREINGYGYTKNSNLQPQNTTSDILHAWPEYYDTGKKTWVSIDPTWGNTTGGIDYFDKLDFSHIAFVRHGEEDDYPLPAGAYKSNPEDKFVSVEVASDVPPEFVKTELSGNQITNLGNTAIVNDQVGYLPPFGTFTLPSSKHFSLYDKIKQICAKLFSTFWQPRPASI